MQSAFWWHFWWHQDIHLREDGWRSLARCIAVSTSTLEHLLYDLPCLPCFLVWNIEVIRLGFVCLSVSGFEKGSLQHVRTTAVRYTHVQYLLFVCVLSCWARTVQYSAELIKKNEKKVLQKLFWLFWTANKKCPSMQW